MTEDEIYSRLMDLRTRRLAELPIADKTLDRVLRRTRAKLMRVLRLGVAEIDRLPEAGIEQQARRRVEKEWLQAILAEMGGPDA